MLVLSRKVGEAIVIDGRITVRVVDAHRDRVKLAFEAPQDVPIHRAEVYERIRQETHAVVPPLAAAEPVIEHTAG